MLKQVLKNTFSAGALVLLTVGCGSSPKPATLPVGTMGVTGSPAALVSYCQSRAGVITTVGTTQVCKVSLPISSGLSLSYSGGYPGTPGSLPLLSPTSPASVNAFPFNTAVFPGDHVIMTTAVQWGGTNIDSSSALFGLFNFTSVTTNCNLGDANGNRNGTALPLLGGLKQGLLISDQKKAYFMGSSGDVTIENAGSLSMGINVAPGNTTFCGSIQVMSARIVRCVDATGTARACQ